MESHTKQELPGQELIFATVEVKMFNLNCEMLFLFAVAELFDLQFDTTFELSDPVAAFGWNVLDQH